MPTTHTWKPNSSGFIFDPSFYVDGTAFVPGDTLLINAGTVRAQASPDAVLGSLTGNFIFNDTGGSDEGYAFRNMQLDNGSSLIETGPQRLSGFLLGLFVNNGLVQVGTATAKGDFFANEDSSGGTQAQFTNNGTVLVQNNSAFQGRTYSAVSTFLNNPGGVVSINSGSGFGWTSLLSAGNDHQANTINNGLIAINGVAGNLTKFLEGNDVVGSGILSVRGAPGASAADTIGEVDGTANSTFDVASGELDFHGEVTGGKINFLDSGGVVFLNTLANDRVRATITGFQAGDIIRLDTDPYAVRGARYDVASHTLFLTNQTGVATAQFTFAGNYTENDFHLAIKPDNLSCEITTTSKANAVTPFAYQDSKTGAAGADAGQQYLGPVNYLQSQYIWASADGVNIATGLPNTFIQGGAGNDALAASAGSNVLDGGFGSNFLTGATGADGGRDTFFLDGTAGTTWDTIANFHAGDSVTLWGFVPGRSVMAWADNEGAPGHTGATIHAAFAGAGTAINGSVTFAGLSLADAQSKLSLTPGNVGGRSYLYVHYNG